MPSEVYTHLQSLMMFRIPVGFLCKPPSQGPHEGKYSSHQIDEEANPNLQREIVGLVQCSIL